MPTHPRSTTWRRFAVLAALLGAGLFALGVPAADEPETPANVVQTFKGHTETVTGVAFSTNGQVLVSGGSDRTLRFWNPANGQAVATIGAHAAPVSAVALNPNNAAAYSAADDGTVKVWQLPVPPARNLAAHADA